MVDAQTIGVLVTATSVTVAAIYIMNLRETRKTRKMQFLQQNLTSLGVEGYKQYVTLMNMEWRDYDDFERKYGSDNNVEATAKRFSLWVEFNSMGAMVRKGMIRAEDLYDMGLTSPVYFWAKYMPIIEENRRRYNGEGYLRDFEYLAGELLRVMKEHDPTYSLPEALTKYIPDK